MKCAKCQFENPEGAKFCNECGVRIEAFCPECEIKNPPGSRFCNQCGKDLSKPEEPLPIDFEKPHSYTPKFLADKILNCRNVLEGERKLVTVLSADVSQFTSMSEKLDPEDVHTVMDGCFRIAMEEIHKYEGTINQFLGDGIMAIFGAPIAHEDHAQRACNTALSLQAAMLNYGPKIEKEYGREFKLRIGINTGNVVVGSIGDDLRMDYTAIGDTTNIAFLLQQIAKPGQIVVSDRTCRKIKGYFRCERLGEEKLKNRKKPVKYYELRHQLLKKTRLDMEEEKDWTRFVNREQELSMLLNLHERAKKNEGQVICIGGEAGEGKTRLIYEFKKRIDLRETLYLESQCISYGKNIPYYPVVEILRKSFNILESDSQEKIRITMEENLQKLDPRLLDSVPVLFKLLSLEKEETTARLSDPKRAKEITFEALRSLILSGSQKKPLVIVIENLQWMDSTSEEFISYIIESIANFPVLLILTYRVIYAHPFGSWSFLRQLSLGALTKSESESIIQSLIPNHRLPDDFVRLILDKAEGNPLFIEEFIKSMIERGIIVKGPMGCRSAKDIKEIEVPDTIQEIILARIDRLEKQSKKTIQTAAVVGREFTLKIIARKEELERNLEKYMRELKHLELVREKSFFPEVEYIFKNAVTKDVVYNSLLVKQRKELHRKIAESIERLYVEKKDDYSEMLSYHYLHSDAIEKSIYYLIRTGEKAKSIYANSEAIKYFSKALDIMDQNKGEWESYKKEAHQALAVLFDLTGNYAQSMRHHVEGMKLVSSPTEKAGCMRHIGIICEKKGDLKEALKFYEEALELIDKREISIESGRIFMNIGWIHNRNGDYDKAIEFCNQALSIFRQQKSDYETALALNNLAVIHELQGQWDLAEEYNAESIRLIEKNGDTRKLGDFYISLGSLSVKKGELKKAKQYFKKSYLLMETISHSLGLANASLHLGKVYAAEGNFNKAFPYLDKSLEMFEKMGTKSKICQNYIALAEANFKKNEMDQALGFCQKGLKIAQEVPYPFDQALIHSLLGEIKSGQGDDKAEKHLAKSVEIFTSMGRKYELAVALEKLGRLRTGRGRKKKGQKDMNASKKIFKELGVKGY